MMPLGSISLQLILNDTKFSTNVTVKILHSMHTLVSPVCSVL